MPNVSDDSDTLNNIVKGLLSKDTTHKKETRNILKMRNNLSSKRGQFDLLLSNFAVAMLCEG